jgi:hypothetical protein
MTGDGQRMSRAAEGLDSSCESLGLARSDDDPRSVGNQASRNSEAYPPARASDDGDLVLVGDAHVADTP